MKQSLTGSPAYSLHIEALIFCSPHPITIDELRSSLSSALDIQLSKQEVIDQVDRIKAKYDSPEYPFTITHSGNGYQFLTKPDFFQSVGAYIGIHSRKRLSSSALDTLAIIAYRQPITKVEIENIRGVNSDYSVARLLEKELVEIKGRSPGPGRPLLYATSGRFMDYFGINDLKELPTLKDLDSEKG